MKRFGMTGVAGYIAPRHLRAIRETGNELVTALDPHDAVGILDSFFPHAQFFISPERFLREIDKLRRSGKGLDYLSVCSPNDLHDSHIRYGLMVHADVICEKPVVVNPWNIEPLQELEAESGHRVNAVLHFRLHPEILALRERVQSGHFRVKLQHVSYRGPWYDYSWKGDARRSGGLVTNIGIHLFDVLLWLFGPVEAFTVTQHGLRRIAGTLTMERADVEWLLSLDQEEAMGGAPGKSRMMEIDGERIDFTVGFEQLHTRVYEEVLAGRGFTLEDAKPAIELTHRIRERIGESHAGIH